MEKQTFLTATYRTATVARYTLQLPENTSNVEMGNVKQDIDNALMPEAVYIGQNRTLIISAVLDNDLNTRVVFETVITRIYNAFMQERIKEGYDPYKTT